MLTLLRPYLMGSEMLLAPAHGEVLPLCTSEERCPSGLEKIFAKQNQMLLGKMSKANSWSMFINESTKKP